MDRELLEFVEKEVMMATHPQIDWKTVHTKGIRYLGHTCTLPKVLNALFSNEIEISIKIISNRLQITTNLESFFWHFFKTSKDIHFNQGCHFIDQPEETKLIISKLLMYKKSKNLCI